MCDSGQTANHQMNHCHLDHGCTGCRQQFVILTHAAVAVEPAAGACDKPALGNNHKPLDSVGTLGNLQANGSVRPQPLDPFYQRPGISPVRPDVPPARIPMPETLQELFRPIAVLHTGGGDHHGADQPEGITEEMPLAAFDLCAGILATEPPFAV